MKRFVLIALAAVLGLAAPAGAQTTSAGTDGGRFYGTAEYLLWWTKDSPAQTPLVDNGSAGNNKVFLGGKDVDFGERNGARLTLGYWLTNDRAWGIEAGGFYLPTATESRSVASPGGTKGQLLAIPFFNPVLGGERISPISGDNYSGAATETMTSRLWGAEGNAVMGLTNQGPWRVDLLGGIRYLNLREKYSLNTSSPDIPPVVVAVWDTQDVFDAKNDFYGAQLGIRGRYNMGRWSADGTVKVALGAMRQNVDVVGSFRTDFFGPVRSFAGGYFAQPTNIGSHSRDVVAVVPEVGLNVRFRLTDWASIVAGYTFLYASDVARPGNQIDRTINPSQAPAISLDPSQKLVGPASPGFKFEGSDFWAHGLNVGLALSF